MSIQASLPIIYDNSLYQVFLAILRRAVDGTQKPLFVDEKNQRVIVGGVASAANNSAFQVQSGDAEVTTAGKGVVLKDEGGSGKTVRVTPIYDAATGNWTLNLTTVSAFLLCFMTPGIAFSANKVISEGIAATKNTVFIDTVNTRVDIATKSYSGGISDVGLFVSSNVVISSDNSNHVVLYATGTAMFNGSIVPSTAPTSASAQGAAILAATQTFSGANTFISSMTASAGFGLGPAVGSDTRGNLYLYAKSIDGITLSSGCYVNILSASNLDPSTLQFTSTTTATIGTGQGGVLIEACPPGGICRICYSGLARVQVNSGNSQGAPMTTSATRCQANTPVSISNNGNCRALNAESDNWQWAICGG